MVLFPRLQLLGAWLKYSRWTKTTAQAELASSGTDNSLIHGCQSPHQARCAHKITTYCLPNLLQEAYDDCCVSQGNPVSFEEWCFKEAVTT
jgi:hemolysin-activating ACP:hemolysin acyltransferase